MRTLILLIATLGNLYWVADSLICAKSAWKKDSAPLLFFSISWMIVSVSAFVSGTILVIAEVMA